MNPCVNPAGLLQSIQKHVHAVATLLLSYEFGFIDGFDAISTLEVELNVGS